MATSFTRIYFTSHVQSCRPLETSGILLTFPGVANPTRLREEVERVGCRSEGLGFEIHSEGLSDRQHFDF